MLILMRMHNRIGIRNFGKAFSLWKFLTNTKIWFGEHAETPFQRKWTLPEEPLLTVQHVNDAHLTWRIHCMLYRVARVWMKSGVRGPMGFLIKRIFCRFQRLGLLDHGKWEVTGALCCPSLVDIDSKKPDSPSSNRLPHEWIETSCQRTLGD